MYVEEQTLTKGWLIERMIEWSDEMCKLWSYYALKNMIELKHNFIPLLMSWFCILN
jgi:hypothetical protein